MFTFSVNIYQYAGNSCAAPLFTFSVQIYQYTGNSHVTPLLTFSVQIYQYTGSSSAILLFTCSVQILTPLKMVSLSSSRRFMRPSVSKYDAHCWAFSGSPRCTSGLGGNLVWGQKHNNFCLLSENEPHGGCCRNSCVAKWRTFLRPQASSKPLHLASEAELCSSTEDRRKQKKKKEKKKLPQKTCSDNKNMLQCRTGKLLQCDPRLPIISCPCRATRASDELFHNTSHLYLQWLRPLLVMCSKHRGNSWCSQAVLTTRTLAVSLFLFLISAMLKYGMHFSLGEARYKLPPDNN